MSMNNHPVIPHCLKAAQHNYISNGYPQKKLSQKSSFRYNFKTMYFEQRIVFKIFMKRRKGAYSKHAYRLLKQIWDAQVATAA